MGLIPLSACYIEPVDATKKMKPQSTDEPFGFVFGYPRTRTSWMSELLTVHGHSFAYHEGSLGHENDLMGWRKMMAKRPEPYVIDCNSGAMILGIDAVFASYRAILVKRDEKECRESLKKHIKRFNLPETVLNQTWKRLHEAYNELMLNPDIPKYDYTELDDEEACKEICEHLAPGFPWDSERFDQLRGKIIVQNVEYLVQSGKVKWV